MKYIKIIIFSMLASAIFTSCEDYLDVDPENSVTFRKYFNTEKDLEVFTNGIRDDFKLFVQNGASEYLRGVVYDEAEDIFEKTIQLHRDEYSAYTYSWAEPYKIISGANILLENHTKPGLSEKREQFYKGVAHFYRGYAYGHIGRMWGDAPIVKHEREIGSKAKESWDKVIDFAIEDTKEAVKLLPTIDEVKDSQGNTVSARDMPSKEAAYALLAHLYAWKASMLNNDKDLLGKAIEAASEVIKSSNLDFAGSVEDVCSSVLVGDRKSVV